VMMGQRTGVIKLLKNSGNAPWILAVWCISHSLKLALKDVFMETDIDIDITL
jgi:hypothetical protein